MSYLNTREMKIVEDKPFQECVCDKNDSDYIEYGCGCRVYAEARKEEEWVATQEGTIYFPVMIEVDNNGHTFFHSDGLPLGVKPLWRGMVLLYWPYEFRYMWE